MPIQNLFFFLLFLVAAPSLLLAAPPPISSDAGKVFINEINTDGNSLEYVELYFEQTVSITGWTLHTNGPGGINDQMTVPDDTYTAGTFLILDGTGLEWHNNQREIYLLDNGGNLVHYVSLWKNGTNQSAQGDFGSPSTWDSSYDAILTDLNNFDSDLDTYCAIVDGDVPDIQWDSTGCEPTQGTSNDPVSTLAAAWNLDECSWNGTVGEVVDGSGNGLDATAANGADTSIGKVCQGGAFDGGNDYVTAGDVLNDVFGNTNNAFTVTAWVNPSALAAAQTNHSVRNVFIAKASDASNDNLEIGVDTDGSLQLYLDTTGRNATADIGSGITAGAWHFVAVTYDDGAVTVFIDGNTYTSTTWNGGGAIDQATGSPFTIGGSLHSDVFFPGGIDEVRVYNRAISSAQVQTLYDNQSLGKNDDGTNRACGCTPVSQGADCTEILYNNPSAASGVYGIDPDGAGGNDPFYAYCDMTTDGGGWTLVLNYLHQGGTNPALDAKTASLPLIGSTSLGTDESASAQNWGHASNALLATMDVDEVRFYGRTSAHARTIHFKTDDANTISYFQSGAGSANIANLKSGTVLTGGESANLPAAADSGFSGRGDLAMTNFPFYNSGDYHWGIQGNNNRWEVDDYPNNFANDTYHQIWVRSLDLPDPAAAWNLDECSWDGTPGEVADASGNGVDATAANGADTFLGKVCQGGIFDGNNDYVTAGDALNDVIGNTNDAFTITAWINPSALAAAQTNHSVRNVFVAKASDSNNDNLEIGVDTDGSLQLYIDASGQNATDDIGSGITANSWHFIAVAYDGNDVTVTIDGTAYASAAWNGGGSLDDATGSPFTIGGSLHSDVFFAGGIDEVAVYRMALTATHLQTLYENQRVGKNADGTDRACAVCPVTAQGTDCSDILNNDDTASDGVYGIDPDGAGGNDPFYAYCDMTTDGGGWTLVLNYLHQGGTNPALDAKTASLPLIGSTSLGTDESTSAQNWGHASNALLATMDVDEVRFYGKTSNHGRVIHFKTNDSDTISYFQSGTGGATVANIQAATVLTGGENANLPAATDNRWSDKGDEAMTAFPFYNSGDYHWGVKGNNNRWEVDDYPGSFANDTYHQVWVRSLDLPDPAAAWNLDECSWDGTPGEVADASGNGLDATAANGADTLLGKVCQGGTFDGSDDYITAGDTLNDVFGSTNDAFTVTAWINPRSLSTDQTNHSVRNVFVAKASDANNDNLEIGVDTDGSLQLYIDASGKNLTDDIGSGITAGSWHFVAVTYDRGDVSVMIDGTAYPSAAWNGGTTMRDAAGSPFTIGGSLHSDVFFNGDMDEVRVYGRALTDAHLQTLYAYQSAGKNADGTDRACAVCPVTAEGTDCSDILNNDPSADTGVYGIDPDGAGGNAPFYAYCDMATDGGGWTLVLNYLHQGGTNPALDAKTTGLPLVGSTTLGVDESASPQNWGHASNALLATMDVDEVRFYGRTSGHGRTLHFKTDDADTIGYFQSGTGGVNITNLQSGTALTGHSANLPAATGNRWTDKGDEAMTAFPFYKSGTYHWGVKGNNNRWEVDDYPGNFANDTFHQVWVRSLDLPDPAAAWNLDECSWDGTLGEVADASGNGVDADVHGDAAITEGQICNGGAFDGAGDYIDAGDALNDVLGSTNNSFTITAWIKPNALASSQTNHSVRNVFIAKASDSFNDNLEIGVDTDGSLQLYIDASGKNATADIGSGLAVGSWHFVAVTYHDGAVSVIIDGTTYASTVWNGGGTIDQAAGSPFTIGGSLHSDVFFNGEMDEVRVYRRGLSANQLQILYANQLAEKNDDGSDRSCGCLAPVAEYRMDACAWDGSAGEVADSSGNGLNGVSVDGADTTKDGYVCRGGAFNGSDHLRIADDPLLDGTEKLTVTAWIYPTTLDGSPRGILSKRVDQNSQRSYSIFFYTGNKLYFDLDGTNDRFSINTAFSTNTWYHIAMVYDGTLAANQRVKVYVNGTLAATASESSAAIPDYASDLHIGTLNDGYAQGFAGNIDEVRIYRNALDQTEIQTVMADTHACSCIEPVGEWLFNECRITADTVEDSSESGNDGTIQGDLSIESNNSCQAAILDGSGDYVTMGDAYNDVLGSASSAFTVAGWVYPIFTGNDLPVLAKASASGTDALELFVASDGTLKARIAAQAVDATATFGAAGAIPGDTWTFVALVYNNGSVRAYINNTEYTDTATWSGASALADASGAPFTMGTTLDSGLDFRGGIDDVRIYNGALSAGEINLLYTTVLSCQGCLNAEYRFDDACGWTGQALEVAEDSGHNLPGTILDGGDGGMTTAIGQICTSVEFDGKNDYISIDDSTYFDNVNRLTMMAWINPDTLDQDNGTNARGLFSKRNAPSDQSAYGVFFWKDQNVAGCTKSRLFVDIDSNNDRFCSNSDIPTNVWTHVAIVFDGTLPSSQRAKIYLNGRLDKTAAESSSAIPDYSSNLYIGNLYYGANTLKVFDGRIDEVKLFPDALSATEIDTIYQREMAGNDYRGLVRDCYCEVPSDTCTQILFEANNTIGGRLATQIVDYPFRMEINVSCTGTGEIPDMNVTVQFVDDNCSGLLDTPATQVELTDENGYGRVLTGLRYGYANQDLWVRVFNEDNVSQANCAADPFAVRPPDIQVRRAGAGYLRAGVHYLRELDLNASPGYDQKSGSMAIRAMLFDRNGDRNDTLEGNLSTSPFTMNGIDAVRLDLNFSDVAVVDINFTDANWTAADTDDPGFTDCVAAGASNLRNGDYQYGCHTYGDLTLYGNRLLFLPYAFAIRDGNLTGEMTGDMVYYDANVSRHGAPVRLAVEALNLRGDTVLNYDGAPNLFANDVNVTFVIDGTLPAPPEWNATMEIFRTAFTEGLSSSALVSFNFGRDAHTPTEAIRIPGSDINATATDRYGTATLADDTNGSDVLDGAVVFVYGRVNPIDQGGVPGGKSVSTSLWYEIYCKECDQAQLGIAGEASVNDVYWWRNINQPTGGSERPDDTNYSMDAALSLGIANQTSSDELSFSVNSETDQRFKIILDLSRHPWLFYHPFDDSNTTSFYLQFFKGAGGSRSGVVENPARGGRSGGRLGE